MSGSFGGVWGCRTLPDMMNNLGPPEELTAAASSVWYHYIMIAYILCIGLCVFYMQPLGMWFLLISFLILRWWASMCFANFNNKLLQSSDFVWEAQAPMSHVAILFIVVSLNHVCLCHQIVRSLSSILFICLLWFAGQSVQVCSQLIVWYHWYIVKLCGKWYYKNCGLKVILFLHKDIERGIYKNMLLDVFPQCQRSRNVQTKPEGLA
jgi:hypothetical protein